MRFSGDPGEDVEHTFSSRATATDFAEQASELIVKENPDDPVCEDGKQPAV